MIALGARMSPAQSCSAQGRRPGSTSLRRCSRGAPEEDFLAESCQETELQTGVEALPGICPGGSSHLLVCVHNESLKEAVVERGQPLLRALDMVAALSGQGESLEVESKANADLKQGDIRAVTALEILKHLEITFSETCPM